MNGRLLIATTTATVLAVTLSGCITVHGEEAVVPAVSKAEAKKALANFTERNNRSNKNYDAKLNATIETGALGAIDQAGLKARKEVHPGGNEDYTPLKLTDPQFVIPKQAGWPKFFVANAASNQGSAGRWLLVFQRDDVDANWKASYLAVLEPSEIPKFAKGEDGYAKAVPAGQGSGLTVSPEKMSRAYTRYLDQGKGNFANGEYTSTLREERQKKADQPRVRTEWADLPASPPEFAPFGLRTRDGGALVFFASHHHTKQTLAKGYTPEVKDPYARALMTGTPTESVTYVRVSAQAVTVPAEKKSGDIDFLARLSGLTTVKAK